MLHLFLQQYPFYGLNSKDATSEQFVLAKYSQSSALEAALLSFWKISEARIRVWFVERAIENAELTAYRLNF